MPAVESEGINILSKGASLLEDVLIFNDHVITRLWVRHDKLSILLVMLAMGMSNSSCGPRVAEPTPKSPWTRATLP
jgi:hypothetical protein